MKPMLTIASYQGPALIKQEDIVLEKILSVGKIVHNADFILFPETFLHGYFDNEADAKLNALDLSSTKFIKILNKLSRIQPTLILGINEIENSEVYNTVVILDKGKLVGKARKATTYQPYDYYKLAEEFPVFYKENIGFGVSICCDINYFKPANDLAHKGAEIIFCPMWNVVERSHGLVPHMYNKSHLIARAQENKIWLVCSDVIHNDDQKIGVGCSCIIDPLGNIVSTAQPLTENLLIYHIPKLSLTSKHIGLNRNKQEEHLQKYFNLNFRSEKEGVE